MYGLSRRELGTIAVLLSCLTVLLSFPAQAEWYVGGYGGWSAPSSLKDGSTDRLGLRIAEAQFPQANAPTDALGRGAITQSLRTSDLALKQSPMFGAKGGYFFTEEKLPWLGVEVETFASKPTIKTQTLTTDQFISFQPNSPDNANNCSQPVPPDPNRCPAFRRTSGTLAVQESDLRVIAVAFNVIARYPGKVFQPYAGAGAGAFYFWSPSGSVQGRQVVPGLNLLAGVKLLITEEWGLFAEGKYNRATIATFDQSLGLSAEYSAFNFVAGVAFHF